MPGCVDDLYLVPENHMFGATDPLKVPYRCNCGIAAPDALISLGAVCLRSSSGISTSRRTYPITTHSIICHFKPEGMFKYILHNSSAEQVNAKPKSRAR